MFKWIFDEFKRMYSWSDISLMQKVLHTITAIIVIPGWVYLWACEPESDKVDEKLKNFIVFAYSFVLWAFIGLAFV